jgi:hypothetical protein
MKPSRIVHLLRRLAAFGRLLLRSVPRIYSAGLILLIGMLTYMAVQYLVKSLATGSGPPPQITALPARLTPDILQKDWAAWQALSATENARSPLAHYHRLDHWMEPDRFNDCTRSGCHAALPHSRRKEVRAFLNMHATSIHCGVCHMNIQDRPLPLVWYNLKTGETCDPPALIAAFDMLTSEPKREKLLKATPKQQKQFVELLRTAAEAAQGSPALERLADHFAALRPGSEAFARLVDEARSALPAHFRGEYGTKLAVRDDHGAARLGHPDTGSAQAAWFARGKSISEDEKKVLLNAVHVLKREKALHCTECHSVGGSMLDLAKLGYPTARRDMLAGQIIFRMIEHINTGQSWHMPSLGAPLDPDSTSKPANQNPRGITSP